MQELHLFKKIDFEGTDEKVIAGEVLLILWFFVKNKDGGNLSLDRFKGCKGGCKLASREDWVADGREETTAGDRRG